MTTFCNCKTCQEIKKRIKYSKCPYCKKHHDPRVACFEMAKSLKIIYPERLYDFCPSCNERHHPNDPCGTVYRYNKQGELIKEELMCPASYKKAPESARPEEKEKQNFEYYLEICNGKYTVCQKKDGSLKALRYGKPWQDLTGNNLVFYLMVELIEAREKIEKATRELNLPNRWSKLKLFAKSIIKTLEGEK